MREVVQIDVHEEDVLKRQRPVLEAFEPTHARVHGPDQVVDSVGEFPEVSFFACAAAPAEKPSAAMVRGKLSFVRIIFSDCRSVD